MRFLKLNIECLRDTLLVIEEEHKITYENGVHRLSISDIVKIEELNEKYSKDDIQYSVKQMADAKLISFDAISTDWKTIHQNTIGDITPEGHEFLENMRTEENWSKVKEISHKVGSKSLSVLTSIAGKVIAEMIGNQIK